MNSDFETYKENVQAAVSYLESHIKQRPEIICVLGTGLGELADHIDTDHSFPYASLPNFPSATVTGHSGNLIFGSLGGKYVAALQGRHHFYEGYSTRELTFPVRVLSLLGPEILLVSNVSGGLNPGFSPGTVMLITDLALFTTFPVAGGTISRCLTAYPACRPMILSGAGRPMP